MRPIALPAASVVAAFAVLSAAAPLPHDVVAIPKRSRLTSGAGGGGPCGWTNPLPPLPAACTAPPTLANCTDAAWLKTPCGSDTAVVQQQYCQKALLDEYCKDKSDEELVFPAAAPQMTPEQAIKGAPDSLFIPPRTPIEGKQVPFVSIAHGGKPPPKIGSGGVTPISQHGGQIPVRSLATAQGS